MRQQNETFLTPVGRMVMGSLYEPQTKSMDGKPLVFRSGRNEGKPRVNYFFALAIKKNGEAHWNQTEWGAKIYHTARALYPRGESDRATFSWKIVDGDSTVPNTQGVRPVDRIGYPGHWVLTFGGAFAPAIIDRNKEYITRENAVNCGDYIQVNMMVNSNKSTTLAHMGIVLNCTHVALISQGEPIEFKKAIDPKTLNISTQLPPDAKLLEVGARQESKNSIQSSITPPPPPYPAILNTGKRMTEKAPGSYDQMIQAGWTDEQLVQHGMMTL